MIPSRIAFRTTIPSSALRPRRLDLSPPFASTSRAHAPEEETRYNCQLKIRFDAFGGMPSSACEASTHSLSKPTTTSSLWLIGPRAAFAAAVPMVRTAHHRSSAGGNIEAISGTWMPSRSRTRITTRTRAPKRSCRSSGEEIDLGSPPAIRISCPIRARPRFVSVPCRSASSKKKSGTENGGSESSANVITANKRSGRSTVRTSTTDALYSPALGPTMSSEKGLFFIAAPATAASCACTRRAFERQPVGVRSRRR